MTNHTTENLVAPFVAQMLSTVQALPNWDAARELGAPLLERLIREAAAVVPPSDTYKARAEIGVSWILLGSLDAQLNRSLGEVETALDALGGGTGLEGVPGFGYGDKVPTLLEPREIVMRRDESDVMRTLASLAVTSPITSSITSSSVATSAASVGSTGSYSGPSASEIAAAIVAALRVSPMNVKADVDVSVQVDRREIARAVQEEAADGGFTISERNVKRF